ncbi:piggyBac transposable element-derived protein 2-like isoform X2 [Pimephales promelas]|uniref:piggyBac transposable element-derived protein 2-like isoform X2 n=1 Tax=Pimephales promelas TaxID=90988 RepID=UPI001955817A|nr:piggyBac transposable element-derived protein 2-like isoform X2 [Pimephales promelas]
MAAIKEESEDMEFIKEESEDMKIEEVFSVKKEEMEEQTDIMDCRTFYGHPRSTSSTIVLLPADPCDSEVEDLSDPDDGENEDFVPPRSIDLPPPLKKSRNRNRLVEVSSDLNQTPSPPAKSRKTKWVKKDIPTFTLPEPVFELPELVQTPFLYFKKLFTDQMIVHITEHTNQYSVQQTGTSINTTAAEIEVFLSVLLYMGVFEFPSLEDYWACESRFPPVADTMSVKRFKLLRRYVHFNDNFQMEGCPDRFHKIRPLFDMFREQCLLIPPTNRQSVDEVMVAYKGTRAGKLRQYIQNKPDKWGFKVFCRGSDSGIIHDFILYQGSTTFFNIQEEEHAHLGLKDLLLGAKVVSILCNTIVHKEATVVFYDNFFTSFNLVKTLHTNLGLRSVGTVTVNRTGGATLMSDKEMVKRGRGFVDFRSSEGVVAVKWFDNKCVTLLSNAYGVEPLSSVKRYTKEAQQKVDVPCPSIVLAYNQATGGIDLSDMLVHLYKTPMKSRRWYLPLFGYIIDVSIVNAWLMYKRDCSILKQKPMPLKKFRLSVAATLKGADKVPARVGRPPGAKHKPQVRRPNPRVLHPTQEVRYDGVGHWPTFGTQRGRCNLCKSGVSRWRCSKCGDGKLFLCLNNKNQCFVAYHQR